MVVSLPAFNGIPGLQKARSRAGNGFCIRIATEKIKPAAGPRCIELLNLGESSTLRIFTNNGYFGRTPLKSSERINSKVEVLAPPFSESLVPCLKRELMPVAVFYNMATGSVAELNDLMTILKEVEALPTPIVVYGRKEQKNHIKEKLLSDYFVTVTPRGIARKSAYLRQEWENKFNSLNQFINTAWATLLLLDQRDNYTATHSQSVALLAYLIGEKMGLTPLELVILKIAGIFHDLGKIGIPDEILNRPGKLSKEEFSLWIKPHPELAVGIVSFAMANLGNGLRAPVLQAVKYHHRYFNGGGYPDLEEGVGELSLLTRILCAADSLDAMTTLRVYKQEGFTLEDKKDDIRGNRGKQFPPEVVDAILELLEEGISVETRMHLPPTNIRGSTFPVMIH